MSAKCDWCGKEFNASRAYHVGKIGKTIGAFRMIGRVSNWLSDRNDYNNGVNVAFVNEFCSQRCVDAFKSKKEGKVNQHYNEHNISTENINHIVQQNSTISKEREKFELEKAKQEYIDQRRKLKIEDAEKYLTNGGKKSIYYFKIIWAYLDKTWKKVAFFLGLYWIFMMIYIKLF